MIVCKSILEILLKDQNEDSATIDLWVKFLQFLIVRVDSITVEQDFIMMSKAYIDKLGIGIKIESNKN